MLVRKRRGGRCRRHTSHSVPMMRHLAYFGSSMSFLAPYKKSFALAWSTQLSYRVNFFVGRLREFVVYGAMLLLYSALPQGSGVYSQKELLTYALIGSLFPFVYGMHAMAEEISSGDLTNYLLRPINYFGYCISSILAQRSLLLLGSLLQLGLMVAIFSPDAFAFQTRIQPLAQFAVLAIGSLILLQGFDFIGGLFSFWTNKGHGMRWLITIFIQFLSGSYIPLDTFPPFVRGILAWTPFPSLLFAPLKAYLGHVGTLEWLRILIVQWCWIGAFILIVHILWKRGLRTYGAYGR